MPNSLHISPHLILLTTSEIGAITTRVLQLRKEDPEQVMGLRRKSTSSYCVLSTLFMVSWIDAQQGSSESKGRCGELEPSCGLVGKEVAGHRGWAGADPRQLIMPSVACHEHKNRMLYEHERGHLT